MSALPDQAGDYLRLRRALGHNLDQAHRLLPDFVACLDATGARTVTVEAALVWAQRPDAGPATSVWARRMTVARGFARHMTGIDPDTEIPPLGLVRFRQRRRPPFIYSAADITSLMSAARRTIPTPLRAATVETIIGLLAATGMRIAEATGFQRGDLDTAEAVIIVRHAKFGKSRLVPLHASTLTALGSYAHGNAGGCSSPAGRYLPTTSPITGNPDHRTMTRPASYTPPATAGTSPASAGNQRFNQPRPSGLHEPCAAMSGTHGSEGGSAGQPAGPTRHSARARRPDHQRTSAGPDNTHHLQTRPLPAPRQAARLPGEPVIIPTSPAPSRTKDPSQQGPSHHGTDLSGLSRSRD
jgi:hypothetical protein